MAEIQAMGRRAVAVAANFDRLDEIKALGDKAINFLGRVD